MEHIVSFLETINSDYPFYIELTGITYPDANYLVERKNSSIYCLEYVIDGEGILKIDDKVYYPKKNDVYILPKGCNQKYYSNPANPFTKIWMNINGPLCDALFRVYKLEGVVLIKDLNLYSLFKDFLSICENNDLSEKKIFYNCSLIFHEILNRISLFLQSADFKSSPSKDIKEYIHRHIYEKLSLEELSKVFFLSPSQITRVFKKAFNETPYDYIINQKIETSKILLVNTNMNIKEISYKLNFADEHYFSNVFKRKTGITPTLFRAKTM